MYLHYLLLLPGCDRLDPDKARPLPGVDSTADTATLPDSAADSQGPDDTSDTTDTSGALDTSDSADTAAPWTLPERPDTDSPGANESWRWGGGEGYPDVVDPSWPVVTVVSDLPTLSAALSAALPGDIVYVADDAEIDLTGESLCVPAGVWLAGGRGVDGAAGGLLYSTEGNSASILKACGDDVRFTGLRIRGPDPKTCPSEWPDDCPEDVSGDPNCAYCTVTAYGISSFGYEGVEVDNNELSGWTYAAVGVKGELGVDVHHNHIHHGWREGLGYGVVIYGSDASSVLIRWNRFDAMRHAVAGQGYPAEDYEARDNLMGENAIGHIFDMHGQDEALDDGSTYAGGDIRVHRNIVLVQDEYSFVVRGRPDDGAWLYDNCLGPSSADAALQRNYYGNFYTDEDPDGASAPNAYGQSAGDCGTLRWCLMDGATGPLRYGSATGTPADELLVGDLDGDGRDDVFGTTGSAWRWANPDGGTWTALASSSTDLSSLKLADLDGDGVDDVFYADGSTWRWSRSGSSSWATLRSSSYGADEVAVGDFDGDGADDIFISNGSGWSYYPNGSGDAVSLAVSAVAFSSLGFGDFDGDGLTDVFYGDGDTWRWSRSGSSSWADLAVSSTTVSDLAFADVDGDGKTDVLSVSGETLRYSSGGRASWATLRHVHEGLDELRLGDFDGDGRADVLVGGCL